MKYGYCRVSTKDKQEFSRQEFVLKEYGIDKMFEEKISGTKKASEREQFELMLKELKEGDTVYFESMSRMARSMQDLIFTTNLLANKMKVTVVFVKENITVGGTGMDALTSLVFNIMGAFAQFERDLISDRTKQGLQAKKEQGVILGKPKTEIADETVATVLDLHHRGRSINAIVNQTELGRKIVVRILKENGEID
jgi:DNA invertase Pin-like site-specific DNA recombinase